MKKKGYLLATVYLEPTEPLNLTSTSKVEVFGEFSQDDTLGAWNKKVLCSFMEKGAYFYAKIFIKKGHKFKFIIDDGKQYTVSKRYL